MLGIGFKLACETIGVRAVAVGGCEREACAAAALLEVMENAQRSRIPVWDDLQSLFGRRERGLERVDAITAGYPCQPFSSAGKRLGKRDSRHLWPAVRRIIARAEPGIVFLENVDGHVTLGLRKVLRDLKRLGYRVASGVFSAEEVGAPHGRKRVFIVGMADGERSGCQAGLPAGWDASRQRTGCTERPSQELGNPELPGISMPSGIQNANEGGQGTGNGQHELRNPARQRWFEWGSEPEREQGGSNAPKRSGELGDSKHSTARSGKPRNEGKPQRRGNEGITGGGDQLANTEREPRCPEQLDNARGRTGSCQANESMHGGHREELADDHQPRLEGWRPANGMSSGERGPYRSGGIFPPGRTDYRRWAELIANGLDPTCLPAIESGVSVVADGMAAPADLLRLGGNGVVPLQAAWAFLQLFACLMD